MIRKTRIRLATITALIGASIGVAQATPYVWTDSYDPADIRISAGQSITYQHNILDPASGSFRPGIDTITSASLTLWLYDDAFFGDLPYIGDAQETVSFNFDGGSWSSAQAVGGNALIGDAFSFFSLANLLSDGLITVGVGGQSGDFKFDKSFLTVRGDKAGGVTSVPEPGTLMLFGLGLLGVGVASRRRRGQAA